MNNKAITNTQRAIIILALEMNAVGIKLEGKNLKVSNYLNYQLKEVMDNNKDIFEKVEDDLITIK